MYYYITHQNLKFHNLVIEEKVRKIVKINNLQFVFMAGRSMKDAIFIVLQEKYLEILSVIILIFSRKK